MIIFTHSALKTYCPLTVSCWIVNEKKFIIFSNFSAELETRLRLEKAQTLKQVDNRIIALKRDINKLKDILAEYGTYEVRI